MPLGAREQKLENSLNFSAGESQNKAQMRPSASVVEQNFQRLEAGGGERECKKGGNAGVGISAFEEFLICRVRSQKIGIVLNP